METSRGLVEQFAHGNGVVFVGTGWLGQIWSTT